VIIANSVLPFFFSVLWRKRLILQVPFSRELHLLFLTIPSPLERPCSSQPSSMDNDIDGPAHRELRSVLGSNDYTCTSKVNYTGFILFEKFKTGWLLAESNSPGETWFDQLLREAHAEFADKNDWPQRRQNLENRIKPDGLRAFCILALAGLGSFVEQFLQRYPDEKTIVEEIPLKQFLESKGRARSRASAGAWAKNFVAQQWKFKPAEFHLNMRLNFPERQIIPISAMEKITNDSGNDKGGVATVFRIEIPEEYVGSDLRDHVSARDRRVENGVAVSGD